MARLSGQLDPELQTYLVAHGTPPDPVLTDLAAETARLTGDRAQMQVPPEQGALLRLLASLVGAEFAVEVGTFTGYSTLCLARGLATGGRLLTCDISEEWTSVARRYWERAGVAERIDLRLAPALDTLRALPREPAVDLAFIDADKPGYVDYWEELVPRMRAGGLLIADNVLYHGGVVEPGAEGNAAAIRRFNEHVLADDRVEQVMLGIADGVTLARRR
ncbi:caffeoyl-CoA O-methyltransferase [Saccharopolyspora erythraea NRRL 2338]|uniref:Class I SAM-dependent methyltransferase n=1 Tax=Saccharopolyspora erythraea TaxID=1836 RepID=A0ABP3P1G5_SACER|nr:class I SAM-dependent methyltransferase [Saccharopolyspora erythraea]EQD81582.1 SAM-dependent methyltransferase [Saccharopolyspora erythraea D]PFG96384.1 caffeoyl-CoA O-methyltransferase [Saccharopolyspora erythraea NRRL 2338]QRK92890.1 class I SAM-dependent methyltransferase [Saccharopolyspora erythraea]